MFRFLLFPFSLIYGLIVFVRNTLFDSGILKSEQFNFPIISVGNITVGGTGKTPHVEYLTKLLSQNFKVAILSRGYKRKTKGFVLADQNSQSKDIGDESMQIKQKYPQVDIAVCEKRVTGVKKLIQLNEEVILLDDAFQHRYVKPGISILLIDFNRRIDQDFLLPYGNLRENESGMKRADIIIVTKTPLDLKPIDRRLILEHVKPSPYQELFFTGLIYGGFQPVFDTKSSISEDFSKNHEIYTILLVTGIASSKPLFEKLKNYTQDIRHIKFADHSNYDQSKLDKIVKHYTSIENDKKIIITTEKDAIKIREIENADKILNSTLFYIPIEVKFIENEEEFNQKIINYVKQNKRNS
jgi:tetraacyldisaccharide 4'-kinase